MAYSEQTLKCMNEMEEGLGTGGFDVRTTSVAYVGVVYEDSYTISDNIHCHDGLASEHLPLGSEYVVSRIQSPTEGRTISMEDKVLFLNWLFNESNHASAFVTKDAIEALKDGYIVLDSGVSISILMPACVASRTVSEWPAMCEVFCDLYRNGINPNVAFLMSHLVYSGVGRSGTIKWDNSDGGHKTIYPVIYNKQNFRHYVENDMVLEPKPPYKVCRDYTGYSAMYAEGNVGKWGNALKGNICDYVEENFSYELTEKLSSKNPFIKSLPKKKEDDKRLPYSVGITRMVEFINTHLKGKWYDE